jgi:hypothetical protein
MNSGKQKRLMLQVVMLVSSIALAFSAVAQDAQVGKIKIEGA